jgi:hypothetical protein
MRSKKRQKAKPFVMVAKEMLNGPAIRQLSSSAIVAYLQILGKYNGSNGDDLSFTYKEAADFMSARTYSKAIKELVKYGFITINRPGGLEKQATLFGISEKWKRFGQQNFDF